MPVNPHGGLRANHSRFETKPVPIFRNFFSSQKIPNVAKEVFNSNIRLYSMTMLYHAGHLPLSLVLECYFALGNIMMFLTPVTCTSKADKIYKGAMFAGLLYLLRRANCYSSEEQGCSQIRPNKVCDTVYYCNSVGIFNLLRYNDS